MQNTVIRHSYSNCLPPFTTLAPYHSKRVRIWSNSTVGWLTQELLHALKPTDLSAHMTQYISIVNADVNMLIFYIYLTTKVLSQKLKLQYIWMWLRDQRL